MYRNMYDMNTSIKPTTLANRSLKQGFVFVL